MRPKLVATALAVSLFAGACNDAPDPGDISAFCRLLETGMGLSVNATAVDYEQLAVVAPPDIRPTVETLVVRARDFGELLAVQPPDLEALFNARFDPAAARERASLDAYAESSCGMVVNRPPATRWNNFVRENHADSQWRDAVTTQFAVAGDLISDATVVFAEGPERIELVEEVCEAVTEFLASDGAGDAGVQVLIGTVVVLSLETTNGTCRLP